jgi:hypothetical protein
MKLKLKSIIESFGENDPELRRWLAQNLDRVYKPTEAERTQDDIAQMTNRILRWKVKEDEKRRLIASRSSQNDAAISAPSDLQPTDLDDYEF